MTKIMDVDEAFDAYQAFRDELATRMRISDTDAEQHNSQASLKHAFAGGWHSRELNIQMSQARSWFDALFVGSGIYFWGSVLFVVCVMILTTVISTLFLCTAEVSDSGTILVSCSNGWSLIAYSIMKDWGAGIGVVGAGAGLAWSTFFKRA